MTGAGGAGASGMGGGGMFGMGGGQGSGLGMLGAGLSGFGNSRQKGGGGLPGGDLVMSGNSNQALQPLQPFSQIGRGVGKTIADYQARQRGEVVKNPVLDYLFGGQRFPGIQDSPDMGLVGGLGGGI